MAAAGVHDDAGAFPRFNKPFAGVRAVELQNEIVQVGDLLHQTGGAARLNVAGELTAADVRRAKVDFRPAEAWRQGTNSE